MVIDDKAKTIRRTAETLPKKRGLRRDNGHPDGLDDGVENCRHTASIIFVDTGDAQA